MRPTVTFKTIVASVFLYLGQAAYAQSTSELQPRDLDGDPTTVEAFYFSRQNVTWLADSNIAASNVFGLSSGSLSSDEAIDIDSETGEMFRETLPTYLAAVNQNNYLGYSGWRLPTAMTDDPGCQVNGSSVGRDFEGETAFLAGCSSAEAPELNQFLVAEYGTRTNFPFAGLTDRPIVWLGSDGPTGRHLFRFGLTDRGDVGQLDFCTSFDGTRNCQPAVVWLVHDGDIGISPDTITCVDSLPLNDGWGWNGTESCRIENVVAAECVDSLPVGDGWGWDGVSSCRVEAVTTCIDTPPANDGWGWDGASSCRIEITNPICVDSPPVNDGWGWDGITSCRIGIMVDS